MNLTKNQKEALLFHNLHRAEHDCSDLTWDEALGKRAQGYANHLASLNCVCHDQDTQDGENIIVMRGGNLTGKLSTNCWYDEIKHYDFNDPKFNPKTGHFTQVVWKETLLIGYGEATSTNGITYTVARYSPSGNVDGEFSTNVTLSKVAPQINSIAPGFEGLTLDEFLVISIHNQLRADHGIEELSWSNQLRDEAKKKAESYRGTGELKPISEDSEFGENSAMFEVTQPLVSEVLQVWYTEGEQYDYTSDSGGEKNMHFSQMIWKDSKEIGFSKLEYGDEKYIIVIFYSPKGNIDGEFKKNVFQPNVNEEKHETKLNHDQESALDAHNACRTIHACPPLRWSHFLNDEALQWAKILRSTEVIKKEGGKRGENVGLEWGLTFDTTFRGSR